MADSDVYDLTEKTDPDARDLYYLVNLNEAVEADQNASVSHESIFNSVIILDDDVVCEICTLDGNLVTL